MTREEILRMEPGPKLNRLIAERVMGWKRTIDKVLVGCAYWRDDTGFDRAFEDPAGNLDWSPSTDIAVAWEVAEVLYNRGMIPVMYGVWFTKNKEWVAMFWYDTKNGMSSVNVRAKSLPFAISRAALLAVMEAGDAE